ncbi:polyhydroxyalkanoate synthesis repressor PhaR [Ancylobacter radicis]|uniref:Polyhydroxyalkanoate synthesis repressor PhaR n=1 Tax=Ancylobacter radicis TaxID=2836179 RepID=A0ABS5R9C4_9HYPH|nr:polyhydroxyalkanoate synthesis repressor PhaR [Ancylobacter radicis]MBS9478260.1 polyhydroxyalkanoate synthesis repressor PhaR [Ancylobacter radicis]
MAKSNEPVTIKKYANRRLYNTGTSTYVTLEDLAQMVKNGEDFIVYDAKSSEDITHSVLTQIIFEQEGKGQSLLPINFLRQIIRFYGDSMQMLVPKYLDMSIENFTKEQVNMREQFSKTFGVGGFGVMEDQVRRNMEIFDRTFKMFLPNGRVEETPAAGGAPAAAPKSDDFDELKRQVADMQKRLDQLGDKKD